MIRVQDIMTRSVLTVTPDTSAETARERMRARGIHHLVVTDGSHVVGLISERDLGGRRAGALTGRRVGELMSPKPVTVSPDLPVRRAANLMRGRSVGSLVVSDKKGRLVGIVTVSDLLDALGRGVERPVLATNRPPLNYRVPHRKRRAPAGVW